MTQTITTDMTMGIDLGDRFSYYCALDEAGGTSGYTLVHDAQPGK